MAIQILFVCACGYRVHPGGDNIDKGIQTVFVDSFTNKTSEAYVENIIRSALIDQFIKGRRLRLVDSRETADALCIGSVDALTRTPLAYSKDNLTAEERITMTVEIILEERVSGKIIWKNKGFSATQDYQFIDITTKDRNRKFALTKLSNDLAEKAYHFMMSDF